MATNPGAVLLTPLERADSDVLFQWINDRDLVLFNSSYRPVHRPQHDAWFDAVLRRQDLVLFAIRTCPERALVGTCQLVDIHPVHRSAELRIRIGVEQARGKGYGTAACQQLVEFGFRDLNLRRIWLQVFADNEPAVRLYRKLGFVEEGRLREAVYLDGQYQSIILMSLLRKEKQP